MRLPAHPNCTPPPVSSACFHALEIEACVKHAVILVKHQGLLQHMSATTCGTGNPGTDVVDTLEIGGSGTQGVELYAVLFSHQSTPNLSKGAK